MTDELIIRREILQNGRSVQPYQWARWLICSVLKAVGQHLVDIHGQHDQEELMRPQLHIAMLDEFGTADFCISKAAIRKPLTAIEAYASKS